MKGFLTATLILCAGCSASLSPEQQNTIMNNLPKIKQDNGQICFFEERVSYGWGWCESDYNKPLRYDDVISIKIDGQDIGQLKYADYLCKDLPAGRHTINANGTERGYTNKSYDSIGSRIAPKSYAEYKTDIKGGERIFLSPLNYEWHNRPMECASLSFKSYVPENTIKDPYCEEDKYSNTKNCFSRGIENTNISSYFSINAKSSGAEPYLIGIYSANEWAFLHSAIDDSGQKMDLDEIDSEVHYGGIITEKFSIKLSMAYLKSHKEKGIDIKIYGKRSNSNIKIPGDYVKSFIKFLSKNKIKP